MEEDLESHLNQLMGSRFLALVLPPMASAESLSRECLDSRWRAWICHGRGQITDGDQLSDSVIVHAEVE
jgi:hypothetical protein